MLERDIGFGERPGDVEQQPARDDNLALTRHVRFDGGAQRELHVRGGELEPSVDRTKLHASEDEHRGPSREGASDDRDASANCVSRE